MPEDIGGSPARILRIGLGALTARQARVRAELLAVLARDRFEQVRTARITDGGPDAGRHDVRRRHAREITAAEVKGYLKAMQAILSRPAPPTPPYQLPAFASICDLVMLNREPARGTDASPLVANNAELLKAQSLARIDETVDIREKAGALSPSPKVQMQAVIAARAEAASVDGEENAEMAHSEPVAASRDQDSAEMLPAVVPAAPPLASPAIVPEVETSAPGTSPRIGVEALGAPAAQKGRLRQPALRLSPVLRSPLPFPQRRSRPCRARMSGFTATRTARSSRRIASIAGSSSGRPPTCPG